MTSFETSAAAAGGPEAAWVAMHDVAGWPRWTASIVSVDGPSGPLACGQTFCVKQPGMPEMDWTVTDIDQGSGFTWSSRAAGVRTVGRHWLSTDELGKTIVHISVEQTGPLARLIWALTGRRTSRYLQSEAEGLAAASAR